MLRGWRNPICTLPFAEPVANTLAQEFAEQRFGRRVRALGKTAIRELALLVNGQARRRVEGVPTSVRTMLWVYTSTRVGDAIMDLAPRLLVPRRVEIDLLIAPALAPLFATDRRLREVHTDPNVLPADLDFILLDGFRSTALRLKAKRYPQLPFASMRGHNAGERFDRTAFADRRMRQLFGLPAAEVAAPTLDLGDAGGKVFEEERFRIAVPLGTRLARLGHASWKETLRRIVSAWPNPVAPPPWFRFFGQGESARKDLAAIGNDFVAAATCARPRPTSPNAMPSSASKAASCTSPSASALPAWRSSRAAIRPIRCGRRERCGRCAVPASSPSSTRPKSPTRSSRPCRASSMRVGSWPISETRPGIARRPC
jgi:hypothetical protein